MRSRCWRGKSQRPSANTTKWKRRLSAATMQTRRDFTEAAPISLRHAALGHTVTLLRMHSIDQSIGLEEPRRYSALPRERSSFGQEARPGNVLRPLLSRRSKRGGLDFPPAGG